MKTGPNIKVCFFSRRYAGFGDHPDFLSRFDAYFFWIERFINTCIDPFFIIGSDKNSIVIYKNIRIYLVEDKPRNHIFSFSRKFFKQASGIIRKEKPGIIHCHNLNDVVSHSILKRFTGGTSRYLVQDHGSVYRQKIKPLWFFFRGMDGIIFNSEGQEDLWVKNRIFPSSKVFYLPEGTSRFDVSPEDLSEIKSGRPPRLLWVGNLTENKDPLTILQAVKELITDFPGLLITFIYREGNLLEEVREYIDKNNLINHVRLLGKIDHADMKDHYLSHDYFVLGSKKEGSGFAAIEAMSCGLIPVLSSIPSFRDITGKEKTGILFEQGNSYDLKLKLSSIFQSDRNQEKLKALMHFKNEWSPAAVVKKYEKLYSAF
mgnify:CR=1 FL=1